MSDDNSRGRSGPPRKGGPKGGGKFAGKRPGFGKGKPGGGGRAFSPRGEPAPGGGRAMRSRDRGDRAEGAGDKPRSNRGEGAPGGKFGGKKPGPFRGKGASGGRSFAPRGDRPDRGDRPPRDRDAAPDRSAGGDKPWRRPESSGGERPGGDRPRFNRDRASPGGRSFAPRGDRPDRGDRPPRDRDAAPDRPAGADKPWRRPESSGGERPGGDRPRFNRDRAGPGGRSFAPRSDRPDRGDRPPRDRDAAPDQSAGGDKPWRRPESSGGERPGGDRPRFNKDRAGPGGRSFAPRGDRPDRGDRPPRDRDAGGAADKPRTWEVRGPAGAAAGGERPKFGRPKPASGGRAFDRKSDRPPSRDRRPSDGKPAFERPAGGNGDKPWRRPAAKSEADAAGDRPRANKDSKPFKARPSFQRPATDAGKPNAERHGLAARKEAVQLIAAVLGRRRALDDTLAIIEREPETRTIPARDRAFARLIAGTVLRRHGQIQAALAPHLERPLGADQSILKAIMMAAAAQLLFLGTPPHAAINVAVDQTRLDPETQKFDRLVNAVLRRVAETGAELIAGQDPVALNIPAWMMERWTKTYGEEDARRIAAASLAEAPLDLSVKSDAAGWAEKLGGEVTPTGTVRLAAGGRIDRMVGFFEGDWWVQDAAAALPGRLLGDVNGLRVADLCAAPGGKTAELIARGAKVTAVDQAADRLDRLRQNLARLKLNPAESLVADVLKWAPPEPFDAVLVDVPCTATGTIRRHPDILHLKRLEDVARQAEMQARLLKAASVLVKPGGLLVYCSCSLEPEEGPDQIGRFLAGSGAFELVPVEASEVGGLAELITPRGYLRTLPVHMGRDPVHMGGMDGFFAARLRKKA